MTTDAALARFTADMESMTTFFYAERSHNSRQGFAGPLNAREYGTIMARMGDMAARSSRLAFLASRVMPKVNLYGTRAQACAAIYGAMRDAMSENFVDYDRMAAPDAGTRSAHTHGWSLADKVIAYAWATVITAGLSASVPCHGWAIQALAEAEGIMLPKVPDTRRGL